MRTTLNVSILHDSLTHCQNNFPFVWDPHTITYLGVQLLVKLTDLYSSNFPPILKTIQQDLQKWKSGPFSWFEIIIKMNILPRLLYLLQTLPIKIPASFCSAYKQMCTNFIWQSKQSWLGWDKLTIPKLKGGIGLPDLHKYYWACQLTRVIDCHVHSHTKAWVRIED